MGSVNSIEKCLSSSSRTLMVGNATDDQAGLVMTMLLCNLSRCESQDIGWYGGASCTWRWQ
jgi:hypothetical protein